MTRREEIVKATKECREDYVGLGRYLTSDDIADAFEEGAEWADKTMIEKVCEWLDNYLMEIGYPDDWMRDSQNMLSGEERFRKAMKEQYENN